MPNNRTGRPSSPSRVRSIVSLALSCPSIQMESMELSLGTGPWALLGTSVHARPSSRSSAREPRSTVLPSATSLPCSADQRHGLQAGSPCLSRPSTDGREPNSRNSEASATPNLQLCAPVRRPVCLCSGFVLGYQWDIQSADAGGLMPNPQLSVHNCASSRLTMHVA